MTEDKKTSTEGAPKSVFHVLKKAQTPATPLLETARLGVHAE